MATKTDISYGIIPIRQGAKGWEVLLINQYSKIGNNTYWILPKGHAEGDETELEAAQRELWEETGLVAERIIESPTFDFQYSFEYNGDTIAKTVLFFVGIITGGELKLDPVEVREAGWFPLEEAEDRLDYKDTKEVFRRAQAFIESGMKGVE
jgi:8-oxo-dGTP pyrophosphatase MutT (NUDIX family)